MSERPRKRPTHLYGLADTIVDTATGNEPDPDSGKNAAVVALGRRGEGRRCSGREAHGGSAVDDREESRRRSVAPIPYAASFGMSMTS
jgi:hypothetical protein